MPEKFCSECREECGSTSRYCGFHGHDLTKNQRACISFSPKEIPERNPRHIQKRLFAESREAA